MPKRRRPEDFKSRDTFRVQRRMCSSCIYRPCNADMLPKLEAQIADPRMRGYFTGFRECHHAATGSGVCCRGFWDRHRDDFTGGQLAQRLDRVEFVDIDVFDR